MLATGARTRTKQARKNSPNRTRNEVSVLLGEVVLASAGARVYVYTYVHVRIHIHIRARTVSEVYIDIVS